MAFSSVVSVVGWLEWSGVGWGRLWLGGGVVGGWGWVGHCGLNWHRPHPPTGPQELPIQTRCALQRPALHTPTSSATFLLEPFLLELALAWTSNSTGVWGVGVCTVSTRVASEGTETRTHLLYVPSCAPTLLRIPCKHTFAVLGMSDPPLELDALPPALLNQHHLIIDTSVLPSRMSAAALVSIAAQPEQLFEDDDATMVEAGDGDEPEEEAAAPARAAAASAARAAETAHRASSDAVHEMLGLATRAMHTAGEMPATGV